jgi:hypothetical protein
MGVQEPVPSCSIWVALQDSPTNGQIANRKYIWIKLTFLGVIRFPNQIITTEAPRGKFDERNAFQE